MLIYYVSVLIGVYKSDESLEKIALGLMIGLLIFHSIIFQLAGGLAFTIPALILTVLFVIYFFILVALITYYIGKEFLPSCRVLLEGQLQ